MDNIRTYISKIDEAFSSLLMAQMMLQSVIPESENEKVRSLAAEFVAKLILMTCNNLSSIATFENNSSAIGDYKNSLHELINLSNVELSLDSVDIDTQIQRHLKNLIQPRRSMRKSS